MRVEHTLHALEVPADPAGETARAFAKASLRRDREIGEEGGAAREQRVGLGTMLGRPAVQIVAGGLVGALECAAIAHIIDDRASPAFFGNLNLAPRAHESPQVCLLRILDPTREESGVIENAARRIYRSTERQVGK